MLWEGLAHCLARTDSGPCLPHILAREEVQNGLVSAPGDAGRTALGLGHTRDQSHLPGAQHSLHSAGTTTHTQELGTPGCQTGSHSTPLAAGLNFRRTLKI